MLYLVPLIAAIAPFFLWAIELYFPYPFFVEEAAKALIVLPLLNIRVPSDRLKMGIAIGLLFAISESTLYIFNIQSVGTTATLIQRLLLTAPLHIVTTLTILAFATKSKKFIFAGIFCAAIIHLVFNYVVRFI